MTGGVGEGEKRDRLMFAGYSACTAIPHKAGLVIEAIEMNIGDGIHGLYEDCKLLFVIDFISGSMENPREHQVLFYELCDC